MGEHIVNCSLGKDSTYMLYRMKKAGMRVDRVLFADVGENAEFPQQYEYLHQVERVLEVKVETVKSEIWTADKMFYGFPSRGKFKHEIRGFPKTIGTACRYRSWLKVDPLEKAAGEGNDVYIGIAADEIHRARCKEYTKGKNRYHFPLVDWNLTEQDCLKGLGEIDLYNPLYDYFNRLGCWWCPKQPLGSLRGLWRGFPELWQRLLQMEQDQGREFKLGYPAWKLDIRFRQEAEDAKQEELEDTQCEEMAA